MNVFVPAVENGKSRTNGDREPLKVQELYLFRCCQACPGLWAWQYGPVLGVGLISFEPGAGPQTELSGFTVKCGDIADLPVFAAIECRSNACPVIRENVIFATSLYPSTFGEGSHGIYCSTGADATIMNNTIVGPEGGVKARGSSPVIRRNIIAHTTVAIDCTYGGNPTISCNNVWDFWAAHGINCPDAPGDFLENPMFCDPENQDYRIHCDSPAAHGYGCGLVGALPVGCGPTRAEPTTWGLIKHTFPLSVE